MSYRQRSWVAGWHSRAAAGMAEELPGFIPQVLRRDDVSLLRADETVFNAMVDGWRAQMLARGLAVDTIKAPVPPRVSVRRVHQRVSVAVAPA